MIIDEDRVPHGFCIGKCTSIYVDILDYANETLSGDLDLDHSKLIAHKVKTWVEQMVSFQDGL